MGTTPNRGYTIPDPTQPLGPQMRDFAMEVDADIDGITGGTGPVISFNGRTGVVVAATNDYTFAQINKATSSLADLTTRSAGDLDSGTLPDGRFPATLPAISGANLTNLNAANLTGTIAAGRMPALTGDVTSSAGSVSTTIANNAVTLAKLADMATASFLGRNTAGTGDPEVLSIATAKTMLGITALTPGSVVFAGASGEYAQDNANLFWDDSANRLGIGLTTPSQQIHVNGANPSLRIQDTAASNIGEFTVTSDFVGIGANRVNATGAIFNSGKTAASIFLFAGSGNSSIFFATSPTNNVDGTQRMKIDKDGKVKIGTGDPTQLLEVTGNTFINAATANLFLKDISTGWQSATTLVITPQANNHIRSTSFTSGLIGWSVSAAGNAEFANVDIRGALHSSIFTFNSIQATAGTLGVFKTSVKLRNDVVIPAGPTYGTTTVNVDVEDHDGLHVQQFAGNDILRLKGLIAGGVGDTWLKVSSFVDNGTWWRYGCIIMAGTNNVTYRAGMGIPDYGLNGQGFIIQTADQTNAPYLQMATHSASFTSNDASGTLVVTPQLRIGNLNGSYGLATDTFGFAAGQYGVAGKSWIIVDPTNGVRIGNNVTTLTQIDASGNASFSGSITSSSGTLAGWSITSTRLTSGITYLASGFDAPATGAMAWFGQSATGYRGMAVRDASAREISIVANNGSIYPYLHVYDGTRARVVLGGLNNAWGSDGSTNSIGMKIWNSSGGLLAHFSDVQNTLSGWTVDTTKISSTGININSGASAGLAFGTTPPTSASVGTGIWLDRTGLYGLASNVVQAKFDAGTGAITAGAGNVVLDANGISLAPANNALNSLKWTGDADITEASISTYDNGGPIIMDQRVVAAGSTNDARMLFLASSNSGGTGMSLGLYAKPADSASWAHFSGTLFKGVGIGLAFNSPQPAPVAMLETYTSAASDTVLDGLAISRWRTTGTPAAGLGVATLYRLASSTQMRDAARVGAQWTTATDASRTAVIVFQTSTSAGALTEVARIGQGLQMGAPTGGDKGTGTINVAGDIYKNNSAYGNPDYVLERWATGKIVRHADKPGAKGYTGIMPLDRLREFIKSNYHLPRFGQEAGHGLFSGGDATLAALEEAYIYIFELEERIERLEGAM